MLVLGKAAGMCGLFRQMILFQEATQMEGGDDFIVRFYQTEAARLGKTTEEFGTTCIDVTNKYGEYYKLFEK